MSKSVELERLARSFDWTPPPQTTMRVSDMPGQPTSLSSVDSAYEDEAWRHIEDLVTTSWWYSTRNAILWQEISALLQRSALWDIGGGSGVVAKFFTSQGVEVVLVEPSAGGAEIAQRHELTALCATLEELHLPDSCLPAVGLFDVLEHLENRAQSLSEIQRVLIPGGHLLLTLPALQSLWSGFDVAAGHYLRYNRRSIRNELERHGFEIQRLGYFFALTVLPLFTIRAIPYRLGIRQPLGQDETLGASGGIIGRVAAWIERRLAMRTPVGTSLLVVARKSAE